MTSSLFPRPKNQSDESLSRVDKFLAEERAKNTKGRLIFALDATASRRPTWDMAANLTAEMFQEAASIGGLELQLVYYRGAGHLAECRASHWMTDAARFARMMQTVTYEAGVTQIERVLTHAAKEAAQDPVAALVFIGDAMEEDPDVLVSRARALGRLKTPAFMFQEGDDPLVRRVFEDVARSTGGAYAPFEPGAGKRLGELLKAVTAFAVGGRTALEERKDDASRALVTQLTKNG